MYNMYTSYSDPIVHYIILHSVLLNYVIWNIALGYVLILHDTILYYIELLYNASFENVIFSWLFVPFCPHP